MSAGVLLTFRDVEKSYGGLRPLRVQALEVHPGALVVLAGLDAPAAEMFTNLATGAILPEKGEVRLLGRSTAEVTAPDEWLAGLDRVGILTDRAVLIDSYTAAQNLAMPLTLDVDPLSEDLGRAAAALAHDVGLHPDRLTVPVSSLTAVDRLRIRFGRALALAPALIVMEHPTASLEADDVPAFAADVRRVLAERQLSGVAITMDRAFADAAGAESFTVRPTDGALLPERRLWRGVRRLFGN